VKVVFDLLGGCLKEVVRIRGAGVDPVVDACVVLGVAVGAQEGLPVIEAFDRSEGVTAGTLGDLRGDDLVLVLVFIDTILTPFSLSPTTDSAVDSLPKLFLAYCTLMDTDDVLAPDDRVAPWGSGSDPVPLLTDCAFGLGPSFLSHHRR
jgi:hypothetical protein